MNARHLSASGTFAFPNEPSFFNEGELDRLLEHVSVIGASDLHLQTEEPVVVDISGQLHTITARSLSNAEMDIITNIFYGSNGASRIAEAEEIDTGYQVRGEGGKLYRYRVNVTACRSYGTNGSQTTIRTISGTPVALSKQRTEKLILDNFKQDEGLVIVCGPTGSGKTTLLGGMMMDIIGDPEIHKKVILYSAPIEAVFDECVRVNSVISQHEVPRHLKSFEACVRNALRRGAKIIGVEECRDPETMQAALVAAETGHCVYSTLHVNAIPESLYRMVNLFSPAERTAKMFEIIEALRLVVVQKLVRTKDGRGRIAVREILVFDQDTRDRLRHVQSLREAVGMLAQMVEKNGQTLLASATQLFKEDLIDARTLARFETAARKDLIDDFEVNF